MERNPSNAVNGNLEENIILPIMLFNGEVVEVTSPGKYVSIVRKLKGIKFEVATSCLVEPPKCIHKGKHDSPLCLLEGIKTGNCKSFFCSKYIPVET